MRFQAVTDAGQRSPISRSREVIDRWAAERVRDGTQGVRVYMSHPCGNGKRPRAELVGNWDIR